MLQADEDLHHSHLQLMKSLLLALKTFDGQTIGSGALPTEEFAAVLTRFFPLKQSESIARLVQAAAAELNVATDDGLLLYDNLFTEVCFVIVALSFCSRSHTVEIIYRNAT